MHIYIYIYIHIMYTCVYIYIYIYSTNDTDITIGSTSLFATMSSTISMIKRTNITNAIDVLKLIII